MPYDTDSNAHARNTRQLKHRERRKREKQASKGDDDSARRHISLPWALFRQAPAAPAKPPAATAPAASAASLPTSPAHPIHHLAEHNA